MSIFKPGGCSLLFAYLVLGSLIVLLSYGLRNANRKIDALEVRLQNMEHLISLSLSESRSPALTGSTNRVPASADEIKQGDSPEIKRRAQRKSGHYPPAHDRRSKGQ